MSARQAIDDAFYEAWRRGLNPDRVDPDRVADDLADGYTDEEATAREVERLRHRREVLDKEEPE